MIIISYTVPLTRPLVALVIWSNREWTSPPTREGYGRAWRLLSKPMIDSRISIIILRKCNCPRLMWVWMNIEEWLSISIRFIVCIICSATARRESCSFRCEETHELEGDSVRVLKQSISSHLISILDTNCQDELLDFWEPLRLATVPE